MTTEDINCVICTNKLSALFEAQVMFSYNISYYKCPVCGTIQTEKPYWLSEAYENAITATDIGLLSRNIDLSTKVFNLITKTFDSSKKFLDFGGGYGVLVRLLRDKGLDFYRQDIYCQNIFAVNHDISDLKENERRFELVSCFEVFEHVADPFKLFEELLSYSSNILVSTVIIPENQSITSAADWWYFAPETGQHITFYTMRSLALIAEKYGMNLYSDGQGLHLFTSKKLNDDPLKQRTSLVDKIRNKLIHILSPSAKSGVISLTQNDVAIAKARALQHIMNK